MRGGGGLRDFFSKKNIGSRIILLQTNIGMLFLRNGLEYVSKKKWTEGNY